ncbi:hypothetical protein COT30_02110 [Candidatus Micrarchaeota archaeon CG08_land_8_20_14_0_20_49_17]|nr:MAG: hypothetical protein AUJ13_02065 [Candidatus Micrarchaeota archaeon CG1_02_49_24]PIU09883.1 MAG: hypothetical protein COT30_02110 [Candidatus Micrarchaeota archaeon CG08_land_8_20_14_0_20_49_17]PIU82587.1 MAG: hypothetical protein COS70_00515 [Candidatus Micrarchaeota archaeon CG06_land_8_20_14_3_00_50_6]PIZ93034.1 MAG: hypothetical protein COX84_06300 [Candidatus Micrarchaeota archaeon CG_4_10_14_0_2_um_filter_49_7]HII53578.1 hypothetical protein [Candidatus Micrarchaeota archaeon]
MDQPFEIPEGIYSLKLIDNANNMVVMMEIGTESTFIALLDLGNELTDLWEIDSGELTYCHIAKGMLQEVNPELRRKLYSDSREKLVKAIKSANTKDVQFKPGKLLDTSMKLKDIVKASKK